MEFVLRYQYEELITNIYLHFLPLQIYNNKYLVRLLPNF